MSVQAISSYVGVPKDSEANFHGQRVVYFGWDHHMMFYAPLCIALPPDMRFGDVISQTLAQAWGMHPEFSAIDWDKVQWSKTGETFNPDFEKSLDENQIRHKDIIRIQTPDLQGIDNCGF